VGGDHQGPSKKEIVVSTGDNQGLVASEEAQGLVEQVVGEDMGTNN